MSLTIPMRYATLNKDDRLFLKWTKFKPKSHKPIPEGGKKRDGWPEIWDMTDKPQIPDFYKLGTMELDSYKHSMVGRGEFQQSMNLHPVGYKGGVFPLGNFPVYVNESDYFMSKFDDRLANLRWKMADSNPLSKREILHDFADERDRKDYGFHNPGMYRTLHIKPDIRMADFNYKTDDYLAMAFATYLSTFLCGISRRNMFEGPKVTQTIARFHVYYHVNRFVKFKEDLLPIWAEYHKDYVETFKKHIPYIYANTPDKTNNVMATQHGKSDYLSLIPYTSSGITPEIGKELLQESTRVFVYCVLGGQAKYNKKITESSDARKWFRKAVMARIDEDPTPETPVPKADRFDLISSLKDAVTNTNAVLNLAITPGIEMIPSNLQFSEIELPGYINLPVADRDKTRFGPNDYTRNKRISALDKPDDPKPTGVYKLTQTTIVHPEIIPKKAVRHVTVKKVVYVRPKVTVESHKSIKVSPIKLDKPKESVPTTRKPDPVQNKVKLDKPKVMEEESPTKTPYARLGEWANTILGLSITVSIVLTYFLVRGRSKSKPAAKSATNAVAKKRDASGKFT